MCLGGGGSLAGGALPTLFRICSPETELIKVETQDVHDTFVVAEWTSFLNYFVIACPNTKHLYVRCSLREDETIQLADLIHKAVTELRDSIFPTLRSAGLKATFAHFEILASFYGT